METKPSILVTGHNGQLGNELQLLAPQYPEFRFLFTDVAELNIADQQQVNTFFETQKPAICINAAAYTAVDKAETDKDIAMLINAEAVGYLAEACNKSGATFIHVSTDYVFDGSADTPYEEDHPVNPVNYYGLTKLRGEELALQKHPSSIIIRTSWVYSYFGNNFVKTMLRLMNERESLSVVNDQYGSPTYAADLAEAIMRIASTKEPAAGIYHFSNEGAISWYDFAVGIREYTGSKCKINAVDTAGYPTPARRPHYSVFNKEKITSAFGIGLKNWKNSLHKCLDLLLNK